MTKVIILAAGQGTRLRPRTDSLPKCMVEFNGKPLIQYQLDKFKKFGISNVNFISGYCKESLPEDFPKYYNPNYMNTNMLYSLFCAENLMDDSEDLIISYGDIIYNDEVLKNLVESEFPISVITDIAWDSYWDKRMGDIYSDVESFKWDKNTKLISELGKKTKNKEDIQGQYIGLFKIRKDYIKKFRDLYHSLDKSVKYDGKDFANMYMTSFIQILIDSGVGVYGVPIQNNWLEFDSISDIEAYENELEIGNLAWIN